MTGFHISYISAAVFHASARAREIRERASERTCEGDNIGGAHNDRTPGASSGHPRQARVWCTRFIGAGNAESEIPASDGDGE